VTEHMKRSTKPKEFANEVSGAEVQYPKQLPSKRIAWCAAE